MERRDQARDKGGDKSTGDSTVHIQGQASGQASSKRGKRSSTQQEDYVSFLRSCPLITKHYVGQYFAQLHSAKVKDGEKPDAKDIACLAVDAVRKHGLNKLAAQRRTIRLEHISKHKGEQLQQFLIECFSHIPSLGHLFFDPSKGDMVLKMSWTEMAEFYTANAEQFDTTAFKGAVKQTLSRAKSVLRTQEKVPRNVLRAVVNLLMACVFGLMETPDIVVALGRTLRYVFSSCANAVAHVLAMLERDLFADMVRRVEAALAIHVLSIPQPSIDYHGVVIHPMYSDRTTRGFLQVLDMLFIANLRRRPVTIIQGVDFGTADMDTSADATGDADGTATGVTASSSSTSTTTTTAATASSATEGEAVPTPASQPMDTGADERPSSSSKGETEEAAKRARAASSADGADRAVSEDSKAEKGEKADEEDVPVTNVSGRRSRRRRTRRVSSAGDEEDEEEEEEEEEEPDAEEAGQEGAGEGEGGREGSAEATRSEEAEEGLEGVAALRRTSEADKEELVDFNFNPRLLVSRKVEPPLKNAGERIPLEEFVNEAVSEEMDYLLDVVVLLETQIFTNLGPVPSPKLSFSRVAPYILGVDAKAHLFNEETVLLQNRAARTLFGAGMLRQALSMTVHRDTLVRDTITQLSSLQLSNPDALKRPLRIKFRGEEGIDEGGLKKEFFQLLIRELFDPKYGMFVYYEDTRFFYFSSTSLEAPDEYRLLGMLLGLAMYNRVILDLHFPFVVYKKLRGESVGLEDLAEFNPDLARGLKQLLDYKEDDVEDVFCRTFSVETEVFGAKVEHELKPGGKDIPLTADNKEEYVRLYVDWILNRSIEKQFSAFRAGFASVVSGSKIIKLVTTRDLQKIICGEEQLDFDELERVASYDHGYDKDSDIIKWFWEIVHNFSDDDKKKLLFFTTGSDRVPVGGLSQMEFRVCKQGADSDQLPTSHTCFNALMLPEYPTKEKLERLLRKAISHAEGFGKI